MPVPAAPPPGLHALDLGAGPEVLVRASSQSNANPDLLRVVLTLHGAGGDARGGLAPLGALPTVPEMSFVGVSLARVPSGRWTNPGTRSRADRPTRTA
jgi:hypothetical protein